MRRSSRPTTSNWPLLDDPTINKAMDQAVYVDDPKARAEAWGKIDDQIMAQAPAVPWVWDNQANIESADVAGVDQPVQRELGSIVHVAEVGAR